MSRYRVAVDVGGTFTDIFVFEEESGRISLTKVPSSPDDPAKGILAAIAAAGVPVREIQLFSHGTTVGTNALITRRFARAGLVATKGFRDVLEIRRATKPDLWDAYKDVAPPYIPRRDRFEVEERTLYDGTIARPLDEQQAREVARILGRRGVESVAVCFVNAYVDGSNERRMKQILEERLPGAMVTISSDILPEIFEPERTSTTVVNAVLGPVIGRYMTSLTGHLRRLGYENEVLVLHSGGGVMTAETAGRYAARVAASGLAGGAVAMAHIAKLGGFDNAIGLDMGGTSTDISLMHGGELKITKDWYVEYGYPIRFPAIELITIGAGGGSIAWIDDGGSLRNGPQSAGAVPGPAAYGKGGAEPTNTDANLLLGRLGPSLLGGEMPLDARAARDAVSRLGQRLGMDAVETAAAILSVANANMCDALRLVSIQKGYDPREFALVVFGGAGPLHGADLAAEMSIPTVIVPLSPGITSAVGCLLVDIRHDLTKTVLVPASEEGLGRLEGEFRSLETEAAERLRREGTRDEEVRTLRYLDMRYVGQWRSLAVACGDGERAVSSVLASFHAEHLREFAFSRPEQSVEVFGLRVTAVGKIPKPAFRKFAKSSRPAARPCGERSVCFSGRFLDTPLYRRADLPAGLRLTGPAVVEQLDSTTAIPPGVDAEVDEYLNIVMHL
ncbi:MAG: hydantoinase/oxoprolinase family protein [Deltaproteobacteria bacterium]|nr:hydantoinase/oxoprolinase family protein [Deltaproteobacteria bacterium]